MIPKIIHQTSNDFTIEERMLSFRTRRLMPDFQYIFWDDSGIFELCERFFPKQIDTFRSFRRGVVRADIGRCLFLYAHGGIYCDTDYRFRRRIDNSFLANICVLGKEHNETPVVGGGYLLGNAFMASEKGFALWIDFVDRIFYNANNGVENVTALSGPQALTLFVKSRKDYESQVTLLEPKIVFPERRKDMDESSIGNHLCWGSWRDKSSAERFKGRLMRWINVLR